jgi:hypothetical protein
VHGLQIIVIAVAAGRAQDHDVNLRVAVMTAANAIDHLLIGCVDVAASAREMEDRTMQLRRDVGRIARIETRQRRV